MARLALYLFLFVVDATSAAVCLKSGDYLRAFAFVGLGLWVCGVMSMAYSKRQ